MNGIMRNIHTFKVMPSNKAIIHSAFVPKTSNCTVKIHISVEIKPYFPSTLSQKIIPRGIELGTFVSVKQQ